MAGGGIGGPGAGGRRVGLTGAREAARLAADQIGDQLEEWARIQTALLKLNWRRALGMPGRTARRSPAHPHMNGLFRRMSFGRRVLNSATPCARDPRPNPNTLGRCHKLGTSTSASLRVAAVFRMTDYWISAEGICSSRLTTLGSRFRARRKRSAHC